MKKGKAILIAGHGSTSKLNEAAVEKQTELLRNKGYSVYRGFKGYSQPLLKNTMVEIADDGFTDVICVQMFMTGGHYSEKVIPKQIGLEDGAVSGIADIGGRNISVLLAEPIGMHRLMTDILTEIAETSEVRGDKRGVLLLGGGSKKPDNQDMVEENVKRLKERGLCVYSAYNNFNTPKPEDAILKMYEDGIDDIVIIPMTIASSGHGDRSPVFKSGMKQNEDGTMTVDGTDIFVAYAMPVGSHDGISLILEDLIKEYL